MVSVGAITVELNLDATKLTAGLRQATSQLNSFANQAKRIESDVSGMGGGIASKLSSSLGNISTAALVAGIGGVTAAVGGMSVAGKEALQTYASFEQVVANTASVTGKTGAEFEAAKAAITDLSKALGAETKFSAEEAAGAMYTLASAGIDVSTMSKDQLKPSLDLAAGTQTDLTKTMETMVAVSAQFGIAFEDSARVADVFATSIGQSQATMEKLAYSFNYVGPVANAAGISFEKTTAALSVLYDNGLKGQQAGTGLRGVIASLANPSKEAASVLGQLGLTVADVNPETHDLSEIMGTLQARGMSTTQAFQLFNRTAAPAAEILAKNSSAIDTYAQKLENAGGTAETFAKEQMDTLAGSWEILKSNYENLMLSLGEALTPIARKVIDALTEMMPAIESFVVGFAEAFVELIEKLDSSVESMKRIGEAIYKIFVDVFGELSSIGVGSDLVHGINLMMTKVADAVVGAAPTISKALTVIIDLFVRLVRGLEPAFNAIQGIGKRLVAFFGVMFSGISTSGGVSAVAFITGLVNTIAIALLRITTIVTAAVTPIIKGFQRLWKGVSDSSKGVNWAEIIMGMEVLFLKISTVMTGIGKAIGEFISSEAVVKAFSTAISLLSSAFSAVISVAIVVATAIGKVVTYFKEHPQVAKFTAAIIGLVAGFGALKTIAGAIGLVFESLPLIMPNLIALFEGLSAGVGVALTSVEAIIAGFGVAITMGFGAIVNELKQFNWSEVFASIVTAFSQIITYVSPVLGVLLKYFAQMPDMIAGAMQNLSPVVGLLATIFTSIISVVTGFIGNLGPTFSNIAKIFDGVLAVIFSVGGALIGAVTKIIGGLAKQFAGIIKTIDFAAIGKLIASGFNLISGIVASFVGAFSSLITSVDWAGIFDTIANAVLSFTGWIASLPWGELINLIVSALQGIVDYLASVDWDAVFGFLADSVGKMWDFISSLPWGTIVTIVGAPFIALFAILKSIDWNKVLDVVVKAFTAVWNYLSGIDWSGIFKIISDAFSSVWKVISGIDWSGIFKIVSDAFSMVWQAISSIDWSGIFKIVSDAFTSVWNVIKDIDWSGIFKTISEAFSSVGKAVGDINWSEIFTAVKDAFSTVWDYIKDIDFSDILGKIVTAFTELYNGIKKLDFGELFTSVKNAISGIFGGGGDGEDAVSGLEQMKLDVEALKTGIENAVAGAKQAIDEFGIYWNDAWTKIAGYTVTHMTIIVTTITNGGTAINTTLAMFVTGLTNLNTMWQTGWMEINNSTTQAISDITNTITTGQTIIDGALQLLVQSLITTNTEWQTAWNLIVVSTTNALTSITNTLITGVNTIKVQLLSMITAVVTMNTQWTRAWEIVRVTTSTQIMYIQTIIKNGATNIKGLAPSWREAGVAIGAALAAGLNSQVSAVRSAASALASASSIKSSGASGTSGITRSGSSGTGETNVKITTVNNNTSSSNTRRVRTV